MLSEFETVLIWTESNWKTSISIFKK